MNDDIFGEVSRLKDPQTYQIIGAAMEVHRVLGPGFLEAVYRQALRIEFNAREMQFLSEAELVVRYKGVELDCRYRADFICFNEVIVEVKALSELTNVDRAQTINYLKATGYRRAVLLNFGTASLQYERLVFG